jgi:cation transport regulator ChaC
MCLFVFVLQWGTAYRLAGSIEQQQQTLQYLEWREKQYDQRVRADVYTHSSSSSSMPAVKGALVYIATDGPQNVNWLGPAPLEDIARQAAAAVGPSGPNYEYVFRLADAMREVSSSNRIGRVWAAGSTLLCLSLGLAEYTKAPRYP